MRTPDIAELQTLRMAVEMGSLSAAARRLHLSQPALSKRLAGLEQLVGVKLLERSSRGVKLTEQGRQIYGQVTRVLRAVDDLEDTLAQLHTGPERVRMAVSHTVAEYVMPHFLATGENTTGAAVELVIGNSDMVREAVADGDVDLGVAAVSIDHVPDPGVQETLLLEDEVVVAVPSGHPWQDVPWIRPARFCQEAMVMRDPGAHTRRVVDRTLAERGLVLQAPVLEVGSTAAAKETSLARRAPALLSRLAVIADPSGRFVARTVSGLPFPRRFVILTAGTPGPRVKAMVERLQVSVAQIAPDR